jgi:radical SAM-linked protein
MRRFRLTFTKGEPVRYISHLDLMRTWERILRRARLKVAHSQGFNPRPRLVFAAPLPVAVTSDAEIVDVVMEDELAAGELLARVRRALCPGIELLSAIEVPLEAPQVMARVRAADYVIELATAPDMPARIQAFMSGDSAPYERTRKGKTKPADMRPAVLDLWAAGERQLGMRLRLDQEGLAVRPHEVVAALDPSWEVLKVHRTALQLKEDNVHAA